jgi:hypothetical protein
VREEKCYMELTKKKLEDRMRSHLGKMRKARETWKKKKKKIEDVEILVIHREIARRSEEWMIPILGELVNWKQ